MSNRFIEVDFAAARQVVTDSAQSCLTSLRSRTGQIVSQISDRLDETKKSALNTVADKSIALTNSQLKVLNKFKARVR